MYVDVGGPQAESLWDESLLVEVKELPEDLAALDGAVGRPGVVVAAGGALEHEFRETGRLVLTEGRPMIALETYVRLMVLKQRYRWGSTTGRGGVGLDPSAPGPPDQPGRAGAG